MTLTRREMTAALENVVDGRSPKRLQLVNPTSLSLSDLVTGRTKGFFKILVIEMRWLEKVPDD